MRNTHMLSFLLGSLGSVAWAATPVDSVVVFADRAEVTRSGKAACKGGQATLDFAPLPMTLDERTLRASASGQASALGVTARVVEPEAADGNDVAALKREIEAVHDLMRAAEEDRTDVGARLALSNRYANWSKGVLTEEMRNPKPDLGRWGRLLDRVRAERKLASERSSELERQLRDLGRKEDVLQRRLARLDAPVTPEHRAATVVVDCKGEKAAKVSLSYVVPSATWRPEYDLRFLPARGTSKTGPGKVELTVAAVIQQSTGEDWDNARISLSTAKPRLGAEAPQPAPIHIWGYEASDQKVLVDAMEKRDKLSGPAGQTGGGPAAAELEDRGRAFSLVLPRRVSIKADGRPYWTPVDVTRGEAEIGLVTLPKLRPWVYQVVRAKNPAAYPLLQGRAHVYRGASYVGDTSMDYVAPGEPMELSLGLDAEVKVERKDLKRMDRSSGFLSSTRRLERAYRTRLTNNTTQPATIEVRESIPVSKVEDVEVDIVRGGTTQGFVHDAHRGFVTWTVQVSPAQVRDVDLAYVIKLPEDWDVRVR